MQRGAEQRNCPVVVWHVGVGSLSVLPGAVVFSVGGGVVCSGVFCRVGGGGATQRGCPCELWGLPVWVV